ncbi:unnamed protein product [Paramecium sonneborni]|uniref:Transmembrane protein n=1 Tax=Paramecium sonneborni TaxID=65129 RepID=A0A8S1RJR3_9CILI|nr:unnamed protein product [Paramecium sonneborni]
MKHQQRIEIMKVLRNHRKNLTNDLKKIFQFFDSLSQNLLGQRQLLIIEFCADHDVLEKECCNINFLFKTTNREKLFDIMILQQKNNDNLLLLTAILLLNKLKMLKNQCENQRKRNINLNIRSLISQFIIFALQIQLLEF